MFSCSLLCLKARNHNSQKAKMHVIVVANQKGGAGKTTLTAHLAVAAEKAGLQTALIDFDPQGSLTAWWNSRQSQLPDLIETKLAGFASKLSSLGAAGYDVVFVDTPPAITDAIKDIVEQATFVLVPSSPSPNDLRAIGSTVDIVHEKKKPFVFVLIRAKPNTRLTVTGIAALSAHGPVSQVVVHDRIDYAGAMVDGRTAQELEPKGRCADEINALWKLLHHQLQKGTKARKEEAA